MTGGIGSEKKDPVCWAGLKAEWSQENNQQDVHDQRNGKRHDVSGTFHP
jgi:hypothetical protein